MFWLFKQVFIVILRFSLDKCSGSYSAANDSSTNICVQSKTKDKIV